jgi:hypothetical protein
VLVRMHHTRVVRAADLIVRDWALPSDVVAELDRLRCHVAVVEPVREYEAPLLGVLLRASLDGAHLKVA